MTLKELMEEIETLIMAYGEDVKVKSWLNHNYPPSINYSEDDDCVYINV